MIFSLSDNALRWLALFSGLLTWQFVALYLADSIFPPPTTILKSLWQHSVHGQLLFHLMMTLMRVSIIFVVAMSIGIVLGMVMGHYPHINALLDVFLIATLNVPALVIIILCYLWLGLTEIAAITAVVINKIPTVTITIREGARAIDPKLLEVARVFKVSFSQTFWRVYLPQLYSYLFAASRAGLSLIWKIVLVVELLGRSNGIGFQLGLFFQLFDITSILAYTFAFIFIILAIENWLLRPLELRLNRWRL